MDYKKLKNFSENFFWGASTSAFQVEGGYNEDGKGLSIMDIKKPAEGITDVKVASDHYHKYSEDVKLLAEMGFKAYRFSIAWPRIYPNGNDEVPNEKGLEFYDNLINELLKYNIEPIVTLHHFDLPQNLQNEYGGWTSRRIIDDFSRYCETVFKRYGDRVKYFNTINEQNFMYMFGPFMGFGKIETEKDKYNMNHILCLSSSKVFDLCHKMLPNAKIGPVPNIVAIYPNSSKPEDVLAAKDYDAFRNGLTLDLMCKGEYPEICLRYFEENNCMPDIKEGDMEILKNGKPDYIAFNYYGADTVKAYSEEPIDESNSGMTMMMKLFSVKNVARMVKNSNIEVTSYGMSIDPVGLRITLRNLWDKYRLPLIITENGCGVSDKLEDGDIINDDYRIDYLRRHIEQCNLAVSDGVNLMGYCPWSAIDLISTREGCTKRYGFIYVNRDEFDLKDLRRIRKKSFYWYKKVIETNGKEL